MNAARPARGRAHGQPGQAPHQDSPTWRPQEGGYRPTSAIGDPIADDEVRELGFGTARRGWVPLSEELAERIVAADARRRYDAPIPFRVPGGPVECTVCGCQAEPSSVGTPTCGGICAAILMHQLIAKIGDALYTQADGSGGRDLVRPITPVRSRKRLSVVPSGSFSVETALERLVDCRTVLERHGVDVRWGRTARCPLHDDEHPSMSLYERRGRSRAHCFPCDFDGDAIDLEAAITGEDVATTIKRWGSN